MSKLINYWEEICMTIFVGIWIAVILLFCLGNHEVKGYYISGSAGKLKIYTDIDWACDKDMTLDRNITYAEAIELVDKLNKTLKD